MKKRLTKTATQRKAAGPAADDGDEDVVAQTGDSADITPWIALILVSGISAEQETAADGYPHYQKAERRPDTEDNRTDIQKTQYH